MKLGGKEKVTTDSRVAWGEEGNKMKWRCAIGFAGWVLLLAVVVDPAAGESFKEQYIYEAGETDSKLSCRAISLIEVKRLLLERIGTYLESRSEVRDLTLSRDEIVSLSAGIVKTEIVEEHWDGKTYRLIAKIEADPGAVASSIEALRKNQEQRAEMADIGSDNEKALERIAALKDELAMMQKNLIEVNRNYERSSRVVSAWDQAEKGLALIRGNQLRQGIEALTKAIGTDRNYNFYFHRGRAYAELEEHEAAIADFNHALAITPEMKDAYFMRGRCLFRLGEKQKGRADIEKAAIMGHGPARRWLEERGDNARGNRPRR